MIRLPKYGQAKIAVLGLGYVGLPLALAFSEKFQIIGFDINKNRIDSLKKGKQPSNVLFTSTSQDIADCNVYIITVPTPLDEFKRPDLRFLLSASTFAGKYLKPGDVVIYESTVYPGCTEEDCVPVLEQESGLKFNKDFFCGYSPERISFGDAEHTLTSIVKVTSGSTPQTADFVDQLYAQIIEAGTYKVSSIRVAEAAKAIENAQRDVNISFVNELALIFDKLGIDTTEVIEAAATKWNFLKFKPGLVGGHCIGVDPYYLAHKAESVGYHPQVILSGRRVNDFMPTFVVNKVIKLMISKGSYIKNARVLILGITFKENCPDIRNSKVIDMYKELQQFGINPDIYDPIANAEEVQQQYGINLIHNIYHTTYHAIILAVSHQLFLEMDFSTLKKETTVLFDAKSVLDTQIIDARL